MLVFPELVGPCISTGRLPERRGRRSCNPFRPIGTMPPVPVRESLQRGQENKTPDPLPLRKKKTHKKITHPEENRFECPMKCPGEKTGWFGSKKTNPGHSAAPGVRPLAAGGHDDAGEVREVDPHGGRQDVPRVTPRREGRRQKGGGRTWFGETAGGSRQGVMGKWEL